MREFENSLKAAADLLIAKFAQVRSAFRDSDVKGGHNERILAEFVRDSREDVLM